MPIVMLMIWPGAIVNDSGSLYAAVRPQVLMDKDADKAGIMQALAAMREGLERSTGDDLVVVAFLRPTGRSVDGNLYLLPYEVDARGPVGIKAYGLSAEEFRRELLELAKLGRVLVLLDACHSGATTMDGTSLAMDFRRHFGHCSLRRT